MSEFVRQLRPDLVAELDAELDRVEGLPFRVQIQTLARRARDEIVALRDDVEMYKRMAIEAIGKAQDGAVAEARAEALEEAALKLHEIADSKSSGDVADDQLRQHEDDYLRGYINALLWGAENIRALKDKRDE
jgi:hypothetical protein